MASYRDMSKWCVWEQNGVSESFCRSNWLHTHYSVIAWSSWVLTSGLSPVWRQQVASTELMPHHYSPAAVCSPEEKTNPCASHPKMPRIKKELLLATCCLHSEKSLFFIFLNSSVRLLDDYYCLPLSLFSGLWSARAAVKSDEVWN